MTTYTNFLRLRKPDETEKYSVNHFNTNADLIDSALARMESKNQSQDNLLASKNSLDEHINNHNNPHGVNKSLIGLGNVENTSDIDKPVSTAQKKAIDDASANAAHYTDSEIIRLISGAPLNNLKDIVNALNNISIYVDDAEKLHFTNYTGADTVLPFNRNKNDGIKIIFSTYDSVAGEFSYPNQMGIFSPLPIETNSFWKELKNHISIITATEFIPLNKEIQEVKNVL